MVLLTSLWLQGLPMKHLYDTDSVYFISGFSGMLWKLFYSLLTKEPKNFCFSAGKNIAQSLRYITSSDILWTKLLQRNSNLPRPLAVMKDSSRENARVVKLQRIELFRCFMAFAIQYFHIKFRIFDGFTSVYDNEISVNTWIRLKLFQKYVIVLLKKFDILLEIWNIHIILIYKKSKAIKRGGRGRAHLTIPPPYYGHEVARSSRTTLWIHETWV